MRSKMSIGARAAVTTHLFSVRCGVQQRPERVRHPRPEGTATCPRPRCDSEDTKFCYYNNYNLNQPRYYCKACARYWTVGGMLRNVPVGAGRRKNKRTSAAAAAAPALNTLPKLPMNAALNPG